MPIHNYFFTGIINLENSTTWYPSEIKLGESGCFYSLTTADLGNIKVTKCQDTALNLVKLLDKITNA